MDVSIGVDIGSTNTKVLVASPEGEPLAVRQFSSEWFQGTGGSSPPQLVAQLVGQLGRAVSDAQIATGGRLTVVGVGVASLAESGVLVDRNGQDVTPIVAWYDPRGEDLLGALPAPFRDAFPGVTGLPLTSLCTFTKLLWFRSQGVALDGTWLTLGEYVAYRLTGNKYAEPSLASRTGLFDQDTGTPFLPACRLLGAADDLLPEVRHAGEAWGNGNDAAGVARGVPITVAGHDHLVAAFANGVVAPDDVFNSCGTGDALVRILPSKLGPDERAALVAAGWTHGWHVVANRHVALGGVRAGLVLRRVLDLIGADRRAEVDHAVVVGDLLDDQSIRQRVTVSGANPHDASVVIALHDDASPAEVWTAALRHTIDEMAQLYARVGAPETHVGTVVAAGGWIQMDSVLMAKQRLFPSIRRSQLSESGASGAAVLGRVCAGEARTRTGELASADRS